MAEDMRIEFKCDLIRSAL